MKVIVVGGHCRNKGAQLMLQAVSREMGRILPDTRLLVSPIAGPAEMLSEMGYERLDFPLLHVGSRFFNARIQSWLASRSKGNRGLGGAAAVLDISGFAYSDQFGDRPLRNLVSLLGILGRLQVPYIMLPQSLGPFRTDVSAKLFKQVGDASEMICARDETSLRHVRDVVSPRAPVMLFPDITLGFSEDVANVEAGSVDYCCLVPNVRMVDPKQGGPIWSERYLEIMSECAEHLYRAHGKRIFFLVHDAGSADMKLAKRLRQRSDVPTEIFTADNPAVLKQFIAGASLVVGSRFHSLASSLSSGVPAVAFGWSHKYAEVFKEYGQDDCVFSSPDPFSVTLLDRLLEITEYDRRCSTLEAVTENKKADLEDMWKRVVKVIISQSP